MGRPKGSKNRISALDKFHLYHRRDAVTGCWNWTKSCSPQGYGWFRQDGHTQAHRWSYATFRGEIPSGVMVLHECDNPPCVNPAHLVLGTAADNSQDMVRKGRQWLQGTKGVAKANSGSFKVGIATRKGVPSPLKGYPRPDAFKAKQSLVMKSWWERRRGVS